MEKSGRNARSLFLAQSAVFAAILCVLSPLAIPIGPIPITLGVFAVMLTAVVLDWRRAALAVLTYLLLGLVGLPVFSGGKGGFGVLIGPTGGYLWAYLPMAILIAAPGKGQEERPWRGMARSFGVCLLSLPVLYLPGTLQYTLVAGSDWPSALAVCVYPFLPFDIGKAICASFLGVYLRRRLQAAKLL